MSGSCIYCGHMICVCGEEDNSSRKAYSYTKEEYQSLEQKLQEAEELNRECGEWIQKNSHNPNCEYWVTYIEESCTCGLDDLLTR